VFYSFDRSLPLPDLQSLVASAVESVTGSAASGDTTQVRSAFAAARMQLVLDVSRRLAVQRDLSGAAQVATDAVIELLGADRAHCLFHDADSGALWVEGDEDRDDSASRGAAGFAARTGLPVRAARACDDSRYVAAVDDPTGTGDEPLLAQPIVDPAGDVHAVLVAVRGAKAAPFSDDDADMLRSLAKRAGPLMQQLALQVSASAVIEEARERQLFRQEAIEARTVHAKEGDVIRVISPFLHYSYWGLLVLLIAAGAYLALGHINEYQAGPAIVRMQGATDVRARAAGTVATVDAMPGDAVARGQVIATLYDAEETAELARQQREFETQMRNFLRNRSDRRLSAAAAAARTAVERAQSRLDERRVRAPHAGVVGDVRVREGQPVNPGDAVASIVGDDTDLYVLVFLPGAAAPLVEPGMPLRLSMTGHTHAYQDMIVDTVGDEVLSATEARRFLGMDRADQMALPSSVVIATARLPYDTFESDGVDIRYHNGMVGHAEVRVRRTSILKAIVPGLKNM
jgi:membrane fusion protein (multidrug efflux system)